MRYMGGRFDGRYKLQYRQYVEYTTETKRSARGWWLVACLGQALKRNYVYNLL